MSDKKIVNQLPVVLQTKAVKNFFEATVEQLYSEANTTPLAGFIGKKTGEDYGLTGAFLKEDNADRRQYNLSPAVNNINPITGDSENLVFYDEFIDTLGVYGVNTSNHNRIFGSKFRVFMPPIEIDKFINYQEYYWSLTGPSVSTITATAVLPINIEKDVLGQKSYTYKTLTLRNGMVLVFSDNNNTIPAGTTASSNKAGVEYIVGGVGEGIYLTPKLQTTSTLYGGSKATTKDYITMQRGSGNSNAWSRTNHWYHRNNFTDVGDKLPARTYRANRPIIEFNKDIEMFNAGTANYGQADVAVVSLDKSDVQGQVTMTIDTKVLENDDIIFFPNATTTDSKYLFKVAGVGTSITLTATSSTAIAKDQTVIIHDGSLYKGFEYIYNGVYYIHGQQKLKPNSSPLFELYDDAGKKLSNLGLYNNSTFIGSKIFCYKEGTGINDKELGFPLTYTPYKSVSEITFENCVQTDVVKYKTFGATAESTIIGTFYYKLLKDTPEYFSYWKPSTAKNEQKIITTHYITQTEVDDKTTVYNIGADPHTSTVTASGYDILVTVNDVIVNDFTVKTNAEIMFTTFTFNAGDIIDIEVSSDTGITKISDSRYEIPLSWRANPYNEEIDFLAEPEYMSHFNRFIERQDGLVGNSLGSSNFDSTSKDIRHAKTIVQTDQDLILASFALDDQPHNLVDALRFVGKEYEKYKARLIKQIDDYYNNFDTSDLSNEYVLDRVLRNLITYSIGKDVFGSSYVLPFGDNYILEEFDVQDVNATVYTLTNYADLDTLTNSLLVYRVDATTNNQVLLTVDEDYSISTTNPIVIEVTKAMQLADTIITKLYNKDRDSAECPPTPSTMGLYPLHVPRIDVDHSFKVKKSVLIGHDGSKTLLNGDIRDQVLLEFEIRLYNSCVSQFRVANSYATLSPFHVRAGKFRPANFSTNEYADLLRTSFSNWVGANKVDYVTNEFYDASDKLTWNYSGTDAELPGHWRGWFEYHYDTVRPHTHPWEMIGFFEKPTWWGTQYGEDFSSTNTALWSDLEQGIIRSGLRENFINHDYKLNNPFSRPGLSLLLPVGKSASVLLTPGEITNTGSTSKTSVWTNLRPSSTDVADQFKDVNGSNGLANGIGATYGSSRASRVIFDANDAPSPGTFWDYDGTVSGSVVGSGFAEGLDGFETPYVYITNQNTNKRYQLFNYTFEQLAPSQNHVLELKDKLPTTGAIAVTVTGVPVLNPANVDTWNKEGAWTYSDVYNNEVVENATYFIEAEQAGIAEFSTTEHSPVVAWAFDGLPIYGPYGYTQYATSGQIETNTITNIKSPFILRSGTRATGPGGIHTGEFVEDYTYNIALAGTAGYTGGQGDHGRYNLRYGVTPDSGGVPIHFYVATQDDTGAPMFPYHVGGTADGLNTYEGRYYGEAVEKDKNSSGTVTDDGTLVAISSNRVITPVTNTSISNAWRFGDGAPVENAWKYSVGYPFAVVESMLLSKPGRFATLFSDPLMNATPALDTSKVVNKVTRKPFDFRNKEHFRIHGTIDDNNNLITNVGYTQFIHSWLTYQRLNTTTDYADKVRKVNIKLAHRMAGFTDKDTLTVRADQTSVTTTSTNLIIPTESYDIVVHASPYKNRNFYSGISIQKVSNGYKIQGFDKNFGYFNSMRRSLTGRTTNIQVGGDAVDYVNWSRNTSYIKDTVVVNNNAYYRAPTLVTSSDVFMPSLWTRLPSLPTTGAVKAVLYLDDEPYIDRINYQTVYETFQDVVNTIMGIGAYQEKQGYDFGIFDAGIQAVRNWSYSIKQFLFFVAGGWEQNNTIDLSPMANKLTFTSTTGMVAKIMRSDKNQFTLIDQDGRAIQPTECEIVRDGNTIEIVPPTGIQIYGAMLFTKEIEHAMIFDNVTDFNDTLFSPKWNQAQRRLRIKGKRTANWSGLFSSEGFIIQGDELKPNLDNMAQSLGRYHELGFIPVEKQIYEQARGLFGYQERSYLTNLELEDDDQFEFYKGMLQSKGTAKSLQKVAKSKNIIQGEMVVFDEWALKVGDFGDLENDQTIELKLEKSDVIHDPQMITLAFPEDTTGIIGKVNVIESKHRYFDAPILEIAAPGNFPKVQATASAVLAADGTLSSVNITNAGTGYAQPVRLEVIAGVLSIANISTMFNTPIAVSSSAILDTDVAGLSLSTLIISNVADASVNIDLSAVTSIANVVTLINEKALINSHVTAGSIESRVVLGNAVVSQHVLTLTGNDFTLAGDTATLAGLNLVAGRFQPKQRYSIGSVANVTGTDHGATTAANVRVTVAGDNVLSNSGTNWIYNPGTRQQIPFAISGSGSTDSSNGVVESGDVNIVLPVAIDTLNTAKENNLVYPHVNVFVNGNQLINDVGNPRYSLTTNQLTIHSVEQLVESGIREDANVYVVENSTVEFQPSFLLDVPGANLNIKVLTEDNIAITTRTQRLYDVTADSKTDDIIFIDIDDTTRFLKKPLGVRDQNLWPTMANVDYTGITDARYHSIPNAGYVNSSTVDFSSFDIPSIASMFDKDILIHPEELSTVHVAVAENQDWNVYRFKKVNTNIAFVEQESDDETAYLYANTSLFTYTDQNQIGNTIDPGRFLDYHIAVKNGIMSDKFVVWVNEETVDQKQVRLSNITPVDMIETQITSLGPNVITNITDIQPGISGFAVAEVIGNYDGTGTALVYTTVNGIDSQVSPTIGFSTANITTDEQVLFGNEYVASNINTTSGTFTINEQALTGNIAAGNAMVRFFNRTKITAVGHGLGGGQEVKIVAGGYSGQWQVEGASDDTFMIDTQYVTGGVTTGNILLPEILITTTAAHDIKADYLDKNIAVHNATQRYYNGVYRVKEVPSATTLLVTGAFPFADQANVNSTDASQPVSVLTTLDHDKIYLNNSAIKIDNISSLDGMIESLNMSLEIRRGWIQRQGSLNISIPMMRLPMMPGTNQGLHQIGGLTPHVTNQFPISTKNLAVAGNIPVDWRKLAKVGFNKSKSGHPAVRARPMPRTTRSGAVTKNRSTTINTSPFNQYNSLSSQVANGRGIVLPTSNILASGMPTSVLPQTPATSAAANILSSFGSGKINMLTGNFGLGGNGYGGGSITLNLGGSGGYGGMGSVTIPANPLPPARPTGRPNRQKTVIAKPQTIAPVPAPIKIKTKKPTQSTNNNGAVVITGSVVQTLKPRPCGAAFIPVPPKPPVPPNARPKAVNDSYATSFETPVSLSVLSNDSDADGNTLTVQSYTQPAKGTLAVVGGATSGRFTYTPDAGFTGSDSFAYTVSDGVGGTATAKATIAVGVKPATPVTPTKTSFMKEELQEQSVTTQGVDDTWKYHIPVAGRIKIIIDMDAATDRLSAYQNLNNHGLQTSPRKGWTGAGVRRATQQEKDKLCDARGVKKPKSHGGTASANYGYISIGHIGIGGGGGGGGGYYSGGALRDFVQDGAGIKYCGVIEFDWNPAKGEWLKVFVDKLSSVYRYLIIYPTLTNTSSTGRQQAAYSGASKAPSTVAKKATPIFKPTGKPISKKKVARHRGGHRGGNYRYAAAGNFYVSNYGGFSIAPMAGYSFMPSVFKKTVKVSNPDNVGRGADLTASDFVNNVFQRVSGGRIIPLSAPPIAPIAIPNRGIRGLGLASQAGYATLGNSGTFRNMTVDPKVLQISSSNYDIQNLTSPGTLGADGSSGTGGNNFGGTSGTNGSGIGGTAGRGGRGGTLGTNGTNGTANGTFVIPGESIATPTFTAGPIPFVIPGGTVYDSSTFRGLDNTFSNSLIPAETLNSEDSPLDSTIDYEDNPVLTIQAKRKILNPDGTYTYMPAGPVAVCPVWSPTPNVVMNEDDVRGLTPGDSIVVNNKTIKIPGTPGAVLTEFECSGGFGYTTSITTKFGKPAVKLSSCTNAPITFKEGCRGGVYKEVLDFHIVKNFSLSDSSQQGFDFTNVSQDLSASGNFQSGPIPAANISTTKQGTFTTTMPVVKTNNVFTGGANYRVGDRLRVIGGTPIASPFGSVHELCVELEGRDYSSEGNIKVFIGDGTTPGSEAEVESVEFNTNDDANGIKSIKLKAGGQGYDPARPPKIRIVDIGAGSNGPAPTPAKVRPIIKTQAMGVDGKMHDTSGLPERVAKFRVAQVDPVTGAIWSLVILDRGVYKEFPADLTTGVALEYDSIGLGDEHSGSLPPTSASGLGQFDPITFERLGPAGSYRPNEGIYGELSGEPAYGTGAKIFLTAREIPDCSEKGDALSKLGFPGSVLDVPYVQHLADLLNEALVAAGYDPIDINFTVTPINDDLDQLELSSPTFDGVEFDELTPGFLDKLGLPPGDYNADMTPLSAVDGTPTNDVNISIEDLEGLLSTGGPGTTGTGGLGGTGGVAGTGGINGTGTNGTIGGGTGGTGGIIGNGGLGGGSSTSRTGTELPEETMVIYGVDNGGFNSDGSSMLGNANVTYVGDLFQYELRDLDGGPVQSTEDSASVEILYLESERYETETGLTLADKANVWIDNYNSTGKWAYLEGTDIKRSQTDLVDPKFIRNTIIYDATTGEKDYDYDMWDPFKGVLPAFVDAEITYFSKHDPVAYSAHRAMFGAENIGQVWWNTNTIRYNWYEQGSNRERWLNWGSSFPGSAITLYEWTENLSPPLSYAGTGTPKNGSEFIVERRIEPTTGLFVNYYYYWVQNVNALTNKAITQQNRKFTTFELARYLADPIGQGLNTVSYISAGTSTSENIASFVMGNLTKTLREDEQNIQINLSRNLNPLGLKHAAWKLVRENDNNSVIPEDLSTKLIDSLCESDVIGNVVPGDNLSEIERYGVQFRPRQTMFKNPKQARRALQYVINEILADMKLNTLYPGWDSVLPTNNFVETINWYDTQRTDGATNKKVRFDDSYKAAFTVKSVKALDSVNSANIPDGQVVMVRASQSERFQLWRWDSRRVRFYQMAIQNETVRLKDTIHTSTITPAMQAELRAFLTALKDTVFQGTSNFNSVFFEMMKFAIGEHQELDWAFKTSYIYVEKEEEDLVQRKGYKPDNFDSVLEYMNEVKPYTSKIREYKDGKRAPIEYINNQMLSDFDVPPYADSALGTIRTLDFTNATDYALMETDTDYAKVYSKYTAGQLNWDSTRVYDAVNGPEAGHTKVAPVRTGNVSLVFDRTDWRLVEAQHDASTTTYSQSIGQNIANINLANVATISDLTNNSYTASGRLFKFDAEVRTQFNAEVETYYGTGASGNTDITTNATKMATAVTAGALNKTLYLVKEKVGGTWQGGELDANVFTQSVDGSDSLSLQSAYGYDTTPFDYEDGFGKAFDSMILVENYEGIFKGNSDYRVEGVTYSGFDGFSFNHLLYGEERPEELVYLSPLENFIMSVRTDPIAYDGTGAPVAALSVGPYVADSITASDANATITITSPLASMLLNNSDIVKLADESNTVLAGSHTIGNVTSTTFTINLSGVTANVVSLAGNVTITSGVDAVSVEYIIHNDLYGQSEYLRVLTDGSTSTTIAKAINAWDTEITVIDATLLPQPQPGKPGAIWISKSERVEYARIVGNVLKDITRGTRGTVVPAGDIYSYTGNVAVRTALTQTHVVGASVVAAGPSEVFNTATSDGGSVGYDSRDPEDSNWLNTTGTQKSLTDRANRSSTQKISAFLQGDSIASIGFDSRGFDTVGWDSF